MAQCSTCQTAGTCHTHLSGGQFGSLLLLTISASLLPAVLPAISGYLSVRFCQMQRMGSEGHHQDPPLGFIFPRNWGTTGIGVLIFIVSVGFNCTFYLLLSAADEDGDFGCAGPLGACGTISCIAGTYLFQVYVFMHVTLTLIPLLVVRYIFQCVLALSHACNPQSVMMSHVSLEPGPVSALLATRRIVYGSPSNENKPDAVHRGRCCHSCTLHKVCAYIVSLSLVAVTMTGMFPAKYATSVEEHEAPSSVALYRDLGYLHTVGILIGCVRAVPVCPNLIPWLLSLLAILSSLRQCVRVTCIQL